MKYDPHKHHRHSIRLKEYDYSQAGAYYVTICIHHGRCLLGTIVDGEMNPSEFGTIVIDSWNALPTRYPNIELDYFTIMPNHIHGIIVITEQMKNEGRGWITFNNIIGAFKSITTNQYIDGIYNNGWDFFDKRIWQRNFYEHIIRTPQSLDRIRTYIANNPAKWDEDKLHPNASPNQFNQYWKK